MLHPLHNRENIELPVRFTNPFDYEPHPLVQLAQAELCAYISTCEQWHEEIERGKMFGVLVVEDQRGKLGFLAAFSGYLDKKTRHSYFVPPIVDLLEEGGFFATEERNISQINSTIDKLRSSEELAAAKEKLEQMLTSQGAEIEALKAQYLTSRALRRTLRQEECDEQTMQRLSAESQQQKGLLRRKELQFRELRTPLEQIIESYNAQIEQLTTERQQRSAALQNLTFSTFEPLNSLGERSNLLTIFNNYNRSTPPAGSGECAAPKLLHYAFAQGLRPVAMGEFWWGRSTSGQVRRHGHYYPACRGKCHPILTYMLQGLEIEESRQQPKEQQLIDKLTVIYEDQYFVAFNKPSGMASVRGLNHTISVQSIAEERYPHVDPNNLVVHRLDMDTSGVLIIAKSAEVQRALQQQFAQHTIRKRYIALLDGVIEQQQGAIELPLAMDINDRPRQCVDYKHGKPSYTHFNTLSTHQGTTRIALYPQTGRTHQLRVHCAHSAGLNTPIIGDRLYGTASERLMLHAEQITLIHPASQRKFVLRCEAEF